MPRWVIALVDDYVMWRGTGSRVNMAGGGLSTHENQSPAGLPLAVTLPRGAVIMFVVAMKNLTNVLNSK